MKENKMQREIKFRFWHKEHKRMTTEGEQCELLVSASGEIKRLANNNACGDPECCGANEDYLADRTEDYILMQYTGLKDKNGVEIYEGEIIQDPLTKCNYLIEWDDEWAGFKMVYHNHGERIDSMSHTHYDLRHASECVSVGNVHQNPELLK